MQDKNAVGVNTNLMLRARFTRKYKDINTTDFMRFSEKRKM